MELRIGIPSGSSVESSRGGLAEVLRKADIPIAGITGSSPPQSAFDWLSPMIGRPQELPALADVGLLDCYFCGTDWVKEWAYQGILAEQVIVPDVGAKKTRIVYAARVDKEPRIVASEYAYIAKDFLEDRFGREYEIFCPGQPFPDRGVMRSVGKTEAKAYYGWVDGIVDITQSGDTIRRFGLEEIDTLFTTEIAFWKVPGLIGEKAEKVDVLKSMLGNVKPGFDYFVNLDRRCAGKFQEYLMSKGFDYSIQKAQSEMNFFIRDAQIEQGRDIVDMATSLTRPGMSQPYFD